MITIPILQTLVFGAYLLWIVIHFGVLPSISQSWYEEGDVKGKKKKWLFVLFIVLISVSTAALGYLTKNSWFYASGGSLLIVAFAPAFRSEHKMVGILHTAGTVGGIAFACYALVTRGIYFPLVEGAAISVILDRMKVPNLTFWQEVNWFFHLSTLGVAQLITLGL